LLSQTRISLSGRSHFQLNFEARNTAKFGPNVSTDVTNMATDVTNMVSSKDAFSLFELWRSQGRFILLQVYSSSGQQTSFDALILDVLSKSEKLVLQTRASNGNEAQLGISFAGAEFTYADTRESPDPEVSRTVFDCFLSVGWQDRLAMIFCVREDCTGTHSYVRI
jgi:hypothetical protein